MRDCLTVMSNDPKEVPCKGCGETRVIFQAHYFAFEGQQVRARCKFCHEAAAKEHGGNIFVKNVFRSLPGVWEKDRLNEATPAQMEGAARARAGRQF